MPKQRPLSRRRRDYKDDEEYEIAQAVLNTSIATGGGGGVTDHGALTGLADNDHPQYPLTAGAEQITGQWTVKSILTDSQLEIEKLSATLEARVTFNQEAGTARATVGLLSDTDDSFGIAYLSAAGAVQSYPVFVAGANGGLKLDGNSQGVTIVDSLLTNIINERSVGSGVTIDGTLIKDNVIGGIAISDLTTLTDGSDADALHTHTQEYMYPVWAEENAALGTNAYEWAMGNGANLQPSEGLQMYVPTGWTCEVVAMSARLGNATGSATIELVINSTPQGSAANVVIVAAQGGTNELGTPVALSNGDNITFRTTSSSGSAAANVATAWIRMRK